MNLQSQFNFVREFAKENEFEVTKGRKQFEIWDDRFHAAAFKVKINNAGYIEVHQWEGSPRSRRARWGRAVYSTRSVSDVVNFCNIILASRSLRAKRREDSEQE